MVRIANKRFRFASLYFPSFFRLLQDSTTKRVYVVLAIAIVDGDVGATRRDAKILTPKAR